jgi:hypothetical protein
MTLEDCCKGYCSQTNGDLNEQSPADYMELLHRKDIEVEEKEGDFRYADSVLHETLKYVKVKQRHVFLFFG